MVLRVRQVLHWFIRSLKNVTVSVRHTKTKEPRMLTVLLFFAIAEPLLSSEEWEETSTELKGNATSENKLVGAGTEAGCCERLAFPGAELDWWGNATSAYCAFTPDESCACLEADWLRVGVELSAIFDEEVASTFVWLEELKTGVPLLEKTMWADSDVVDELALIVCARLMLDRLEWSLQISSSFTFPGHSHSLLVTSSIGLHFPSDAQFLPQSDPVHALERSAKGLGLSPGAVWVTCPMHPWNLDEWKSL